MCPCMGKCEINRISTFGETIVRTKREKVQKTHLASPSKSATGGLSIVCNRFFYSSSFCIFHHIGPWSSLLQDILL